MITDLTPDANSIQLMVFFQTALPTTAYTDQAITNTTIKYYLIEDVYDEVGVAGDPNAAQAILNQGTDMFHHMTDTAAPIVSNNACLLSTIG